MSEETTQDSPSDRGLIGALVESEYLPVVGFALGLLVFPWLLIDGLQFVGEFINVSMGGYQGLPQLVLIYGVVVVGFNILLGFTGLLSFGHAAFFGTAAYVGGLMSWTIGDPVVMTIAGAVVATLLAWPIGFVSIRRSGVYFAVITLTFGQMLFFWAMGPGAWLTNGDDGFSEFQTSAFLGTFELDQPVLDTLDLVVFQLDMEAYTWEYVFVGIVALIAVWTANRMLHSPYGLIFKALGENQQRVSFVGLNVFRYKLMAFIISAAFAGVGGAMWGIHESYIHPGTAYYWIQSGDFVIMTVLGGAGSLIGPVFGALIFEYVSNVISGVSLPVIGSIGSLWRIVLGGTFVIVVWAFPRGIYPPIRDAVSWLGSLLTGQGGDD